MHFFCNSLIINGRIFYYFLVFLGRRGKNAQNREMSRDLEVYARIHIIRNARGRTYNKKGSERERGRIRDEIDLHRNGRREACKVVIIGLNPLNRGDREMSHCRFMPVIDVSELGGYHFDAGLAVCEANNGDCPGLMHDRLGALGIGKAVGNSYMAVCFGVDPIHFAAEEKTVSGGVVELIESDIIMDHLMEDRVLNEGFREVNTRVDTEHEVLVAVLPEKALFAASEGEFAEEAFGVGEADGDGRERPTEETGIEIIKAGLDVGDGGDHEGF